MLPCHLACPREGPFLTWGQPRVPVALASSGLGSPSGVQTSECRPTGQASGGAATPPTRSVLRVLPPVFLLHRRRAWGWWRPQKSLTPEKRREQRDGICAVASGKHPPRARQRRAGGRGRCKRRGSWGAPFSSPRPASGSACLPAKAGGLGASPRVLHTSGTGSGARQGAFRRAGLGLPSGPVLRAAPMLDTPLDRSCSVRGDALRLMQTHGRIQS